MHGQVAEGSADTVEVLRDVRGRAVDMEVRVEVGGRAVVVQVAHPVIVQSQVLDEMGDSRGRQRLVGAAHPEEQAGRIAAAGPGGHHGRDAVDLGLEDPVAHRCPLIARLRTRLTIAAEPAR